MIKKILLGLGLLSGMVLIPHALYAGSTRIIEADQLRYGSALLSLPTATQTLVGTSETQTLTNKTLTSPSITTPTGITKSDVGLGNVDNTSDATKNSATATLTNKTLTSPVINSPTGLVKADVGLGNVDNTSDATKNAAAVQLTNKDIDGGTASNTSRLTIPKNTLANATALTRKEGTIIYATDQAKPYYDNGSALVAVGSGSGSGSAGYNTIQNTDAETDTSNWTESGGTFTRTNTAGELLLGAYSFKWTPSAAQNLRSAAVTIPDGLFGRNCYAQVIYKTASTDYTMQILDGSNNVIGSYAMPAASTAKIAPINFVCPTSGTIKLGFVTTASAVQLDFDSAFLGEATNITTSTNVTDWVSFTPTGTWTVNSTYTGLWRRVGGNMQVQYKIALSGAASGTLTSINIPAGYTIDTTKMLDTGGSGSAGTSYNGGFARISGSGDFLITHLYGSTTSVKPYLNNITAASYSYYSTSINATTPATFANGDYVNGYFEVPILGWSAEPAFRPDLAALSWSGYHDSTCAWARTNTAYGDPAADTTCALVERTNRNFGTVTSYLSGSDKLPGIVFTPPRTGRYYVCAAWNYRNGTLAQNINARLWDGTTTIGETMAQEYVASNDIPGSICGILDIASTSSKTISLQTKTPSGTVTIGASGATSNVEWSVVAIDQGFPAPILLGSVTSKATGAIKHEAAQITVSNSAAAVVTQMGSSWVSVSNGAGAGLTTATISGFSAAPACQCTVIGAASTSASWCGFTSEPSSTTLLITRTRAGAAENGDVNITCTGPK